MGTNNTSHQSLFSNHNPLFSSIVTLYTLILLYFPHFFLKIIFSPLIISTLILLLFILRLGASQQLKQPASLPLRPPFSVVNTSCEGANAPPHSLTQNELHFIENQSQTEHGPEPKPKTEPTHCLEPKPETKPKIEPNMVDLVLMQEEAGEVKETQCNRAETQLALEPSPNIPEPEAYDQGPTISECLGWAKPEPTFSSKSLLEWDVDAPLEVIYEAYEGEEEGEEVQNDEFWRNAWYNKEEKIERYPSLSRYYPETDSDSDSGYDSYSEDKEKEGLIDIALDYGFGDKRVINVMMKVAEKQEELHFDDEDNLIEIDISSTKNMCNFAW